MENIALCGNDLIADENNHVGAIFISFMGIFVGEIVEMIFLSSLQRGLHRKDLLYFLVLNSFMFLKE